MGFGGRKDGFRRETGCWSWSERSCGGRQGCSTAQPTQEQWVRVRVRVRVRARVRVGVRVRVRVGVRVRVRVRVRTQTHTQEPWGG